MGRREGPLAVWAQLPRANRTITLPAGAFLLATAAHGLGCMAGAAVAMGRGIVGGPEHP